eukprot:scaffold16457_cov109-Isochrysis_galbana.AAC.1
MCSACQQQPRGFDLTGGDGRVQRGGAAGVWGVWVCARVQQPGGHVDVTRRGGPVQGGVADATGADRQQGRGPAGR